MSYWDDRWDSYKPQVNGFARRNLKHMKGSVLDLGCGLGGDSIFFAKNGLQVTAVDNSSNALDKLWEAALREGVNIRTIKSDISDMKLTQRFDVIYAHLSLHYFDDNTTKRIFAEISRALKKGGILLVKCKSVEDSLYGVGEDLGNDMFMKGHIRHFFSKEYMKENLKSLKIIKIRKTSSNYHSYKASFIEAYARKIR